MIADQDRQLRPAAYRLVLLPTLKVQAWGQTNSKGTMSCMEHPAAAAQAGDVKSDAKSDVKSDVRVVKSDVRSWAVRLEGR